MKNRTQLITALTTLAVLAGALGAIDNDVVLVPFGSYGKLTYAQIGTADDPIVIDGNNATAECVEISGQYITLRNLEVAGCVNHGVYIKGQHIVVENNFVHDTAKSNNVTATTCSSTGQWGSAIKGYFGAEDVTIRNNTVYHNCGEGIAMTRVKGALVEGNTVYDNFSVNIYVDNSHNVVVRNNFSYCTNANTYKRDSTKQPYGIAIGEEFYTGWGAQLHDILVTGNNIDNCRTGIIVYPSEVSGTLINATISNNVAVTGQIRGISVQSKNVNVVISNNKVFNSIYVSSSAGVTVANNIVLVGTATPTPAGAITPTATKIATATLTKVPTASSTPPKTASQTPSVTPSVAPVTATPKTPTLTPVKTPPPVVVTVTPFCDPVYVPFGICIYKLP